MHLSPYRQIFKVVMTTVTGFVTNPLTNPPICDMISSDRTDVLSPQRRRYVRPPGEDFQPAAVGLFWGSAIRALLAHDVSRLTFHAPLLLALCYIFIPPRFRCLPWLLRRTPVNTKRDRSSPVPSLFKCGVPTAGAAVVARAQLYQLDGITRPGRRPPRPAATSPRAASPAPRRPTEGIARLRC
jgi:hypothetical protein